MSEASLSIGRQRVGAFKKLGGHFGYFLFFSVSGRGRGGGVRRGGRWRGKGVGGMSVGRGGGLNIFFRGRNAHQEKHACRKNAFKHSYTVECGNRLRVGVRAKNASVLGFACQPF